MTTKNRTALPSLRAFTLTEGLKLGLTAFSLGFICLAGQYAQNRRSHPIVLAAQTQAVTSVRAQSKATVSHHLSPIERFARSQIQMFSETLDGLTERAEIVTGEVLISDGDVHDLRDSLRQLDQDLMSAREAYARFEQSKDKFTEEDLKESLMAVQESASRAQGELITLDQPSQPAQGFKVSRTGQ